ncbi:sensor histidine kinase [Zobellia laminariae]|uniref:sensor histidine kinase n=2 Tax=Zobellia laminariae TaxID=248906 RepID=UPI0026F46639|nr:histidine kinase [Zobellia laminariae]WKX74605.1 histidine kinase [Zobellia laminariae]
MTLTPRNKAFFFYTLQIIGWYVGQLTIFFMDGFSSSFQYYFAITGGLAGIIATSLYRIYLKNNIDFEVFDKQSIVRFTFAFFGCCGLYYSLSELTNIIYDSIWTKTPFELEFISDHDGFFEVATSVFVMIFLWTIAYFTIKFIIEQNKNHLKNLELNATLREAQLNTLKGQVNPHFLFNSINNVRGLMLEDVGKSQEMISKLSEMLEYAFAKNTVDAIPLCEELEMVENYIALSKIQMEERLQYVEKINEEALQIPIPPMIIQLLIENAAKHGIANLKEGGTIALKVAKDDENLFITVANTGELKIAKDSTQLGLKNIRQRLRLLYGQRASFLLQEIEGGVVASIKIPLE